MTDDSRETKTKMKPLFTSKDIALTIYGKEEIFLMRWLTIIIISSIIGFILFLFAIIKAILFLIILFCVWSIPPIYFFRKSIYQTLREKISYWWNAINGRLVK